MQHFRHPIRAFAAVLAGALLVGNLSLARAGSVEGDPVFDFVRSKAGAKRAPNYTRLIQSKSSKYGLPPMLVAHIIEHESHFDPRCRTGPSMGLMQVNHGHATKGDNLYDPATNIEYGCRILREYHSWAADRLPDAASSRRIWELALTAYNWGPTRAASRGLYRSRYSNKVMRTWQGAPTKTRTLEAARQ